MTSRSISVLLFVLVAAMALPVFGDEQADQARKTLQQFFDLALKKDADGMVKLSAVPFYTYGGNKATVVDDKAELRKLFEKQFPPEDVKISLEIREVMTFEEVLQQFGDRIDDEDRKALDRVVKKEDYVLNVMVKNGEGNEQDRLIVVVGRRAGKMVVVGVRD